MHEFHSTVDHEPCIIRVISYEPFRPGRTHGDPDDCYPDEGGYGDWEICDLDGKASTELASRITALEALRIEREIFEEMESRIRDRR